MVSFDLLVHSQSKNPLRCKDRSSCTTGGCGQRLARKPAHPLIVARGMPRVTNERSETNPRPVSLLTPHQPAYASFS
jgi:hypothetical protein